MHNEMEPLDDAMTPKDSSLFCYKAETFLKTEQRVGSKCQVAPLHGIEEAQAG